MLQYNDYDSSASGYNVDAFEGISREFTDVEVLAVSEVNIVAKGKRYGRWWLLKGLRKEVANESAYQQRLRKELEILMQLQQPNVVTAIGLEDVEGMGLSIVMEYVDGVTLKEWLQDKHTLSARRRVADELIDAVSYIHSKGIVHRDLKPTNIIVARNGENLKLIDFGLADTDSHAVLKQVAGTPKYMSPEQMSATTVDVRNDIYSLGVVFQQMDLGYNAIVRRCLMPIDERFQNMTELRDGIRRHNARSRRWLFVGIAALFAILLTFVIGLAARQKSLSRTISSQHQTIGSQQRTLTAQEEEIEHLKKVALDNEKEADMQKAEIAFLSAENQQRKESEEEARQKALSQQRIDKCFVEGVDSLREAILFVTSVDEMSQVGLRSIRSYIKNHSAGLSEMEKRSVENNLKMTLEEFRKGWLKAEDLQNSMKDDNRTTKD
ncbi:MAG: Kae1-associated serine/threonine protein kinase [Bacteroidaceae bacterium]|nr:Kae1-associated serine/threonine protein kinase [Bacteroidaceae bacterium]